MDVVFKSKATYHWVKESNFLTPENVARSLGIAKEDIVWMGFFEPALAFKVTIPRFRAGKRVAAGGFMENDVHGSQQHIGLANLKLPGKSVPLPLWWKWTFGPRWLRLVGLTAVLGSVFTAKRLLSRGKGI